MAVARKYWNLSYSFERDVLILNRISFISLIIQKITLRIFRIIYENFEAYAILFFQLCLKFRKNYFRIETTISCIFYNNYKVFETSKN